MAAALADCIAHERGKKQVQPCVCAWQPCLCLGLLASGFNLPKFSKILDFFLNNSLFTSEDQKSFKLEFFPHTHTDKLCLQNVQEH